MVEQVGNAKSTAALAPLRSALASTEAASHEEIAAVESVLPSEDQDHSSLKEDELTLAAKRLVDLLERRAKLATAHLRIERDEETQGFNYRLIARETGEVLREWPPESVFEAMKFLNQATGLIVDRKI